MWTLDTRIEVTPVGSYVAELHSANKRLMDLTYPGLNSEDPRVKKQATAAATAANGLMGRLQDELDLAGAWPLKPDTNEDPATD